MNSSNLTITDNVFPAAETRLPARLLRIAAFIIFTAVGAQLAVRLPFTPVPVTMQTLFVILSGVVLGPRDGFYAMVTYLLIGAAGAPVFAGLTFGPAVIAGPTGGYLLAFPAAALISGGISELAGGRRVAALAGALCGSAVILLSGGLYLSLFTSLSFTETAAIAITPFIAGDAVKVMIASILSGRE